MTYQQAGRIAVLKRILGWVIFIPALISTLISLLKFMNTRQENKEGINAVMLDFTHVMIDMMQANTPFLNLFWYNSPTPNFNGGVNVMFWVIFILIFVGLALLSSFLCMFIASGSAIWSILAPIFVPMFMLLGFHPAFAQILFRIADSSVLPLAPVSPFVPLFLGFLQRYKPDAKLGTYYSLVLPYPLIFLVVWLLMLLAWYLVGLPIGPGIYPRLS